MVTNQRVATVILMTAIGSKVPSAMGLIANGSGCWDTESYQELQVVEVEVEFIASRGVNDKAVSSKRHMLIEEKCAEDDHQRSNR